MWNKLISIAKILKKIFKIKGYLRYSPEDLDFPYVKCEGKKIVITEHDLSHGKRRELRTRFMATLRKKYPKYTMKAEDIKVGYYDKCLWRYLDQVYTSGDRPQDTCWHKYAQNNKCVDKLDKDESFNDERKKLFLKRLKMEDASLDDDVFKKLVFDENNCIYILSDILHTKSDKVEELSARIKKRGWDKYASISTPIIIGYSCITGKHQIISGRHRIAVLKYLINQGLIRSNIKIHCHYIEYPFDTLSATRPYSEHCKQCRWDEKIVFDGNTHQDFSVAASKINILGKKAKSKWQLIEPVSNEIFSGKTMIDIGAYRGLYCMKALEYGATKATAFEPENSFIEHLRKLKIHTAEEKLEIFKGDFYNVSDYQYLTKNTHDTALFLGIIHHLLRLGIQRNLLHSFNELISRIAHIVNYGVVIEFALPTEKSLLIPEMKEYKENFSLNNFEGALTKHFSCFKRLGKCRYSSGNKFGRFMYYAIK